MQPNMRTSFNDRLAQATGGRRYCFMIMSYTCDYQVFEAVRSVVVKTTGLECIRADDIRAAGEDLRAKIHAMIESAAFVIAEISEEGPNVYYEVGYAIARGKETLLLAREDIAKIPTDLAGVELIRYRTTRDGWEQFKTTLQKSLEAQTGLNDMSLVRAMIVPPNPDPSFILASPKSPNPVGSRFRSHPIERRTYGDHLGIVGILRAFGAVFGELVVPELVSAERADPRLLKQDGNLYLIGSPKSNGATRAFLEVMQAGHGPRWTFGPAPGEVESGDYEVQLSGELEGRPFRSQPRRPSDDPEPLRDVGLILRGPSPQHPGRMVTILAGPHSGGTGGACLAATNSTLIMRIVERLPHGVDDLVARDRTMWVLVSATPDPEDRHVSPELVEILGAGVCG